MKNKLENAYSKRLKFINKNFFEIKATGVSLFVEYLKYLRDSLIITAEQINKKTQLATITAAVAEFDAYQKEVEVAKKQFHWDNFWEIIKQNMEDWITTDDSI